MDIGGKKRPIKIGLNQSILYCELRGISITEMNEDFQRIAEGSGSGSEIRDLIWSALKDGARVGKLEFTDSNLDVGDWLEEMPAGSMREFMEEVAGNMPKANGSTVKKKATV